uniref:Ribosomal protein-like n=1 Tax=Oryza sativa subsp. japonica TaxID=39947 RepID=Q8GVY1_ORYSJ|nr:ribosomal protein-like [Oryza sativa Japonica Group]
MSQQSDTPSCSDDSEDNIIDPASIYTIEEFISEQSIMDNLLERITVKIQSKIEAQKAGTSHHPRGERKSLNRNHEGGHQRLVKDYFSQDPIYSDKQFRARRDASSRQGLSPLQKCTAAIRILACGSLGDANEKYVEIGKSTELECLERFVEGVIDNFGEEYLRSPTSEDMQHILQVNEARGFPGMLGSTGCMRWEWKNCPVKWKRHLTHTDHGAATMILEAVASHDHWIWHAFFAVIGSNNEMKIISQQQLFTEVLKGQVTQVQFSVNGKQYNTGYYLADGTYPEGNVFIKTVSLPQSEKDRIFARHQEGARKDVQEAFRLLQSRFAIVRGPTRFFQQEILAKIMQACIILHNMTIEDEKDMASACFDPDEISGTLAVILSDINTVPADSFTEVLHRNASVCAPPKHTRLRRDLMEHIWQRFGPFGNQ